MKKTVLLLLLTFTPAIIFAQPPGPPGGRGQKMFPRREQIEMLRIWKMTEELDLTEKQAEKFFPRLRTDDKHIEELEMERQSIFQELHKEATKGGMDEKTLDEKIERISIIEASILKNRVNFIRNMDDLLSPDQRAKLLIFRHRFRDRMENMMREARKKRQMMNNNRR